ncbi:hypothetical protein [Paenibacillus thermotolerans]|uniref:hypothetical protein n=1 Tax=Paenibacillus thermotolerans TaxID=3027807 RepID=UPI002368A0EF|nr:MULTISPECIES: hypothetical protein [unclassified Paenibacillus]
MEPSDNQDRQELTQETPSAETPMKKKHSGLGIASFIMAIVSILGLIGCFTAMAVMLGDTLTAPSAINPEEGLPENIGGLAAASLGMFASVFISFVGAILGIIGLFQKDRAKLFAILGTVFNALITGFFVILLAIGAAIGLSAV